MSAEQPEEKDRQMRIKEAREKFDAFVADKKKGRSGAVGEQKRMDIVDEAHAKYGSLSVFDGCSQPYMEGVVVVVKTLNVITEMGVHTKQELIAFDTAAAVKHKYDFGERNGMVVELLKGIYRAELDQQSESC